MKIEPRLPTPSFSLAASEALVDEAGYSAPTPYVVTVKLTFEARPGRAAYDSDDASRHNEEPEQAFGAAVRSVGGSTQGRTEDDKQSGHDDGEFSAQVIAYQLGTSSCQRLGWRRKRGTYADGELADDGTDQEGIGDPSRPGGRVYLLGVDFTEDDVEHGQDRVLVSIADKGGPCPTRADIRSKPGGGNVRAYRRREW